MPPPGVAIGIEPRSTELRAEYCNAYAAEEADRVRSSRRAGQWLVGVGVTTLAGSGATYLATTQTEREQTDKTLNTLGSSLLVAGAVTLVSGVVVLVANKGRDERARRAASLATDIAAEGELPLIDESVKDDEELRRTVPAEIQRANALDQRNKKTTALFRECLGLEKRKKQEAKPEKRVTIETATPAGGTK